MAIGAVCLALISMTGSGCQEEGPRVAGQILLAPAFRPSLPPTAVLFVVLFDNAERKGTPIALARFEPVPSFPVKFEITSAQSMTPDRTLPAEVYAFARIALSGAPRPIQPEDIEGVAEHNPVKAGAADVRIVLYPPRNP